MMLTLDGSRVANTLSMIAPWFSLAPVLAPPSLKLRFVVEGMLMAAVLNAALAKISVLVVFVLLLRMLAPPLPLLLLPTRTLRSVEAGLAPVYSRVADVETAPI